MYISTQPSDDPTIALLGIFPRKKNNENLGSYKHLYANA